MKKVSVQVRTAQHLNLWSIIFIYLFSISAEL